MSSTPTRQRSRTTATIAAAGASLGAPPATNVAHYSTGTSAATRCTTRIVPKIRLLGAGIISREGFNVRGLNPAANL